MRRFNYSINRKSYLFVLALLTSFSVGPIAPLSFSASRPSAVPRERKAQESKKASVLEPRQVSNALAKLPMTFEANLGQLDKSVRFFSRGNNYDLFLTSTEAVFSFSQVDGHESTAQSPVSTQTRKSQTAKKKTSVVRMRMVGANAKARIEALSPQSSRTNYFIGDDPRAWKTNTLSYGRIKYHDVFPGIDLDFYGDRQGIEYDYIVAPGADPGKIKLKFKGADRITIDAGELVLHTPSGELRQHAPVIYQEVDGVRQKIEGGYILKGSNVTFSVGRYDSAKPLVIDPTIVYSTYLGSSGGAQVMDIAIYTDPVTGNTYAYVVGTHGGGADFPTKNPMQVDDVGSYGAFVAKINMAAAGEDSLVYSTYLGGNGNERATSIAVDSTGAAYLTGGTASTDFPMVNAFQTVTYGSCSFVTKVTPDGSGLVYSSYLGGSELNMYSVDATRSIAVDPAGNAYVAGNASSTNFPLLNGFRTAPGPGFIAKIATPSGANPALIVYSTYIDGIPMGIAVDSFGNAYAAGVTYSFNLPTTAHAFQPNRAPGADSRSRTGFITKVNTLATGQASLAYSTYFGGSNADGRDPNPFAGDNCHGIALDSTGNVYVTGITSQGDFPTTPNAFQPTFSGGQDTFAAKFDTTKSGSASLVYSTFLGGRSTEQGWDIAIDAAGNAYLVGMSASADFPIVNSFPVRTTGVFVTADEGASFGALNKGLASYNFKALVIDTSTVPRTLYTTVSDVYGSSPDGILKSIDGGNNWNQITSLAPSGVINCMALDPQNPAIVYAGTDIGIFKSSDGGNSWSAVNNGLTNGAATYVSGFTFDSTPTTQTIYVGTSDNLYKSTDAGNTWLPTALNSGAETLVINTATTPHTLFVRSQRSTDGGSTWTPVIYDSYFCCELQPLGVDTSTTPATIYANDPPMWNYDAGFLLKSTDNGDTWEQGIGNPGGINRLIIDTTTAPSTFYALAGGISKSTDGGNSWTSIANRGGNGPFAIDTSSRTSTTPATLYFTHGGVDASAFVSKLNPMGSALIFSTLVAGEGAAAMGVALDTDGNIYVVGATEGSTFPTVNALQPNKISPSNAAGFVAKLGSAALPSNSNSSVTTQVAVQSVTLAITLPNITGSATGTKPAITVTPLESAATANFSLSNNLGAYEISTTALTSASVSNPIRIAFQVSTINDPTVFNNLQVIHIVNGVPLDATSSRDFATRTIYAQVTSFSPFVIVKGATDQIRDLVSLVKGLNLRNGIANSLDAKLQNAEDALVAARSGYRQTACNRITSFTSEVNAQTGKAVTSSQAGQLIAAGNQIKASMSCQ